jgi:hypothetical protein
MDFSFWSQEMLNIDKKKPRTLCEMRSKVEDFLAKLGEDAIRLMTRHAGKQALASVAAEGRHFEHEMK